MRKFSYIIIISVIFSNIGYTSQFYFASIKAGELFSPVISGLIYGIFFTMLAIFGIIIGKLSDYLKKRKIFAIIGNIVAGTIYLQYFYTNNIFFFLIFSGLAGIGVSTTNTCVGSLLSEFEPNVKRGKLMSYYNTSNCIGWAGGIIIGELISLYMFNLNFIILGIFPFISSIMLFFISERSIIREKVLVINKYGEKKSHYEMIKFFLIYLMIIVTLRQITSLGVYSNVALYLGSELGATNIQRGIISASDYIFAIIFMIPTGIIADKYGRKRSLLTGIILSIISIFGYAIIINPWHILIFYCLGSIAWALIINGASAFILDITIEANRARGNAFLSASISLGGIFGPFLESLMLILTFGNFRTSYLFLNIFSFPSLILCLLLRENKKTHIYSIFNKISKTPVQIEK
jgi:MFS family permease